MVVNQWIIIRVSHNTMDVIHGYQLTYCSYSWLSKIPWMLIMVNHGSYSFIVVSGGTRHFVLKSRKKSLQKAWPEKNQAHILCSPNFRGFK